MSSDGDPIDTAQALTGALGTLSARLEEATRYGRRNRHLISGLAVSIVLDVMLTVVLTLVAFQARAASDTADQVHEQQVVTCKSGNESRAANVQLWDYVLSLPSQRPLTAAEKAQRDQFRAYVHRTFAPRDCSRI